MNDMDVFAFGMLCAEGEEHDAAWHLLSVALSEIFGLNEMPEVRRGDKGKPYFPEFNDICFNLSHSHGAAVCAVHDKPIGVDVEKLRPAPKCLAAGMDDRDFFCLWTAKEASVKRRGGSAAALLRDYEPDALCRTFDDFLFGWIVTVCPSESAEIRFKQIR